MTVEAERKYYINNKREFLDSKVCVYKKYMKRRKENER